MKRDIFCKKKKEKGFGLLAITMIFCVAIGLLASAALLTASRSSSITEYVAQGNQAEQIANTGIDRVLWMVVQDCLKNNTVTQENFSANTVLSGADSSSCNLTSGSASTFTFPVTVPVGQYKVKIISCTAVTDKTNPNVKGRKIVFESLAQVHRITKRVIKTVELYDTDSNLFTRAIMGNNVPSCMFCHLNIYGSVGFMNTTTGVLSHGASSGSCTIHGDFDTAGPFYTAKGLCSGWGTTSDLMKDGGRIQQNYNSTHTASQKMPTVMDTFKNNKAYILKECTDSSTGQPGTIKVDFASQIIPGALYTDPNTPSLATKVDRIIHDTDPNNGGACYGIHRTNPIDPNSQYYISAKYDLDSTSNLDPNTTYSNPVTLTGTDQHPIIVNGKTYIDGDVIIRGTVSGQGVIYSSRNIYILGNLDYKDPPVWSTNMSHTPYDTTKNQLGLVAAGNIMIGDPFTPASTASPRSYYSASAYGPKKYDGGSADYGVDMHSVDSSYPSGKTTTQYYRWQGYIRSLMVDGLFAGNEAGNSDLHYASRYTTWSGISPQVSNVTDPNNSNDNFVFHNQFAWDGRDQGEIRVTRNAEHEDTHGTGTGPGDCSPGINKYSLVAKQVNTFGLLPRGSRAPDNPDVNTPSKAVSYYYTDIDGTRKAWIPYSDWRNVVNQQYIMDNAHNQSGASLKMPHPTATINGYPDQVDGILYAEGCLVGANFEGNINPNFHGSFISNDTHYINAGYADGAQNTNIYYDDRANSNFMGFPHQVTVVMSGYDVRQSSPDDFASY